MDLKKCIGTLQIELRNFVFFSVHLPQERTCGVDNFIEME